MLRVLEERDISIDSLLPLASNRSAGITLRFRGEDLLVQELSKDSFEGVDYALFSAGGSISREFAPIAAAQGCVVIDNSSAWRMDPNVPLVVPEVNPDDAYEHKGIIANPNCSTIQMVVALKPLADAFGLKRVIVSTYQSPSGAGILGVNQLTSEVANERVSESDRITKHKLAYNTVFHTVPEGEVETEEEMKMMRETKRIMHRDDLPVSVTCVRVPVLGGHGESVVVELEKSATADDVRALLHKAQGIVVIDDPEVGEYPTTQAAENTDEVYVGRVRKDPVFENGIAMWVVADNLRKGAATNAVQILELLTMKEA